MKAIILAGGRGERLRPLTDETPKPLLPIQGKPIIEHAVENLKKHGIKDIILSIGHLPEKIQSHLGTGENLGVNLLYNIEKELLGTGGAVADVVKKFDIKEPFLLLWGDNIGNYDITKLREEHEANAGLITMGLTPREDVEDFGAADLDGDKIKGFVEKPKREEAPSNLINAGVFVIEPEALEILPEGKSSIEKKCFEPLSAEGKLYAHKHEGYWFPTDTLEKYQQADKELGEYLDLTSD